MSDATYMIADPVFNWYNVGTIEFLHYYNRHKEAVTFTY